jgi:hypothetical protein
MGERMIRILLSVIFLLVGCGNAWCNSLDIQELQELNSIRKKSELVLFIEKLKKYHNYNYEKISIHLKMIGFTCKIFSNVDSGYSKYKEPFYGREYHCVRNTCQKKKGVIFSSEQLVSLQLRMTRMFPLNQTSGVLNDKCPNDSRELERITKRMLQN